MEYFIGQPPVSVLRVIHKYINVYSMLHRRRNGRIVLNITINSSLCIEIQGGPKTGLYLRVDNFATVSCRKACDMSKVYKFCLEKEYNTCMVHASAFKYSLLICINSHYP